MMSLTLVRQLSDELVTPHVIETLRRARAAGEGTCVLCPSLAEALGVQRRLAEEPDLCLGVTVTTPEAWATERWEVWGDGRRVLDGTSRDVHAAHVLREAVSGGGLSLRDNPGTVGALADLSRAGMPWLRGAPVPGGLTRAEAQLVSLLVPLSRELDSRGQVEPCEVMVLVAALLREAGVDVGTVALLGVNTLSAAERALVCGLAEGARVLAFARVDGSAACAPTEATLGALGRMAGERGIGVELSDDRWVGACERAPELERVLGALFEPGSAPVAPTGAVRLALPAGPSAEPALVASVVEGLLAEGDGEVVVCGPDPVASWRALAPRLAAKGIACRAQLSVVAGELDAGRAFLELARSVARLRELADQWPPPVCEDGLSLVELGPMQWWPPQEIVDFLMSGISGVPYQRACRLDAGWRSNRLLTPQAVLDQLMLPRATSPETAAATRELLRGRLGSAASRLLGPLSREGGPKDQAAAEAEAALSAVLSVAGSLRESGLGADPAVPGAVTLSELVRLAEVALSRTSVPLRLGLGQGRSRVLVCDVGGASRLAPCSVDAVVLCGQTSTASGIRAADDVTGALLDAFGVEPAHDAMALARQRFERLARVCRRHLVLERTLFTAGSPDYPSVMLTELLACYGADAQAAVPDLVAALGEGNVSSRGESEVSANASPSGRAAEPELVERPAPAGVVSPSRRACVMPPAEGTADEGLPVLSASQIETYLECPYKWFSLRRLRLSDVDAGLTGAEMGTFAHRVLEVTHRELLARSVERALGGGALAEMREGSPRAMQDPAYRDEAARLVGLAQEEPRVRYPGSAVADAREEAREVLGQEFEAHLSHQRLLARGGRPLPQALVAHTASQQARVEGLAEDLASLLDFESSVLAGYEPRFLEWGFGRHGQDVEYAGVRLVGTVDRIDVDAHGQAVVIDYKHKPDAGFAGEYDAFGKEGPAPGFRLPRRVQSLIYAQVVRRAFPGLSVRGAVYLCTRGRHELAGAVDEEALDRVFGIRGLSRSRVARVAVPRSLPFGQGATLGMEALLDASEQAIAGRVSELLAGNVEARPIDDAACSFCPVLNCERRRSK